VSRVKKLVQSYRQHIAIPWRKDAAAAQRVIFCIYDEADELKIRAIIAEFELATRDSGYEWKELDLTDSFPRWMSTQRYANKYFQQPKLLYPLLPKYLSFIEEELKSLLNEVTVAEKTAIAITGVGSLFGFIKVKEVVDRLAPLVLGRLIVFFPGSYEDNNYRLLDGYDGWNYLAVPITADKEL